MRSVSRMPTGWPARERDSASCVVVEDLPTPPLPERTWVRRGGVSGLGGGGEGEGAGGEGGVRG